MLTLALADPQEQITDTVSTRGWKVRLQTLIEAVEARLMEPLAVPELAEMASLSQNYLARVFRLRYGMTIPHFILLRRIELARHLLATSKVTIKAGRPRGRPAGRAALQQAVPPPRRHESLGVPRRAARPWLGEIRMTNDE